MIFKLRVFFACQAEFATSAVDFLHRVGRTARAGQPGMVTSLFTESNRDLVAAVRQAENPDLPVVNVFDYVYVIARLTKEPYYVHFASLINVFVLNQIVKY